MECNDFYEQRMTALRRYCDMLFNFHEEQAERVTSDRASPRIAARPPARSADGLPPFSLRQTEAFPDHNGTIPASSEARCKIGDSEVAEHTLAVGTLRSGRRRVRRVWQVVRGPAPRESDHV
jgi:hypothetical protein